MPPVSALDWQARLYLEGFAGRRSPIPVDFTALERAAQERLSPKAFGYLAGGAGREGTMAANRLAFDRWKIVPRMLRGVADRSTTVDLFGQTLPTPILLAPIGVLELAHRQADTAVGRAAAAVGTPFIFSNQASVPMEHVATGMGTAPRWFQLYWSKSNELVESLVRRAEACGCAAIVVTLDTTLLGWRTRDLDAAYLPFLQGRGMAQYTSDPVFRRLLQESALADSPIKPGFSLNLIREFVALTRRYPGPARQALRAVRQFVQLYTNPALRWADLAFLRERTNLPILLKGILHPDDARAALDHGIDGLVVSNHGGRQVDGAIAALDALPGVVAAVDGRIPVLLDSGVRGGADVFKALALGARAVCIGRPYAYGLAVAGQRGVEAVLRNLLADFELTMALAGCRSVPEITRERLAN